MLVSLDRNSDRPLYKQLADLLRRQILSGELPAGAAIPSKNELAAEYGVTISGVVDPALAELKQAGLILMRRGHSTTVLPVRIDIADRYLLGKRGYGPGDVESAFEREHGVPWSVFSPELERRYVTIPASRIVAQLLGIPGDALVVERTWVHKIDGVPVRLAKSYLEAARFGSTILCDPDEPPNPGGTSGQLKQLGIDVHKHLIDIGWREANDEERALFNSEADKGMLEQWRVHLRKHISTTTPHGIAVETACHVWPAKSGKRLRFAVPVEEYWYPPEA